MAVSDDDGVGIGGDYYRSGEPRMSIEAQLAVLQHRTRTVEQAQIDAADSIKSMSDSVTRMATVNEQSEKRHAELQQTFERLFTRMDANESRIGTLENKCGGILIDMGYLKEARGWVVGAAISMILLGISGMAFFIRHAMGV